ncbi:DUF5011 domain-containing protein [Algivirga pacifica]|uniref:Pesticidal crystal protein Cry22Aa Ig-like domain-containing protein n=1 Tax=Algivirga pacifica TaxID=1162670 RepID=A0ABP9DIT3_9BACT
MNKIKPYITIVAIGLWVLGSGCDREDNVSTIINFAVIELQGDEYVYLNPGDEFTDPGATATENEQEINVNVSGTVDTATPGVYEVVYSAQNSEGFEASETRYVIVRNENYDPSIDITGSYDRGGNPAVVTARDDQGLYFTTNGWGSSSVIPFEFVDLGGGELQIVPSTTVFGPVSGTGTINDPEGDLVFFVTLSAFGIVDSKRVFTKVE